MNVGVSCLRCVIFLYQAFRFNKPSPCRFVPTCSTYALEAIEHHGVLVGSKLTLRRLTRCRPRGGWGADPIPR